jgi:hypothetical protein
MPTINLPGKKKPEPTFNRRINKARYNSPEWIEVRKKKLALNPVCEICKTENAIGVTHKDRIATNAETSKELLYDIDGLLSVCDSCQRKEQIRKRKEAHEQRLKK